MPLQATSGAASYDAFGGGLPFVPTYIEDVFSTWLYTGNGASGQSIVNGIDLSTKGGLVWLKSRTTPSGSSSHNLYDTVRGASQLLISNATDAQTTATRLSFQTTGFNLTNEASSTNESGIRYASWTFRKQPKFFDVVTYTGDGVIGRTVSHNLNATVGFMLIKCTSQPGGWVAYHRSVGASQFLVLNATDAASAGSGGSTPAKFWNSTAPTSTVFSLGDAANTNETGQTYVAYLFAHNAGGFGLTGTDNVISCGSFTGNGSSGQQITLGYEPQFIIIKQTNAADTWRMYDNMRGMGVGGSSVTLQPNDVNNESTDSYPYINSTGFTTGAITSGTFIYIAIRRGPMKTPTSGTSVFAPVKYTGNGTNNRTITSGFPVDHSMSFRTNSMNEARFFARLTADFGLTPSSTDPENQETGKISFASNTGAVVSYVSAGGISTNQNGDPLEQVMFQRAPGFFDVVCWTSTGSTFAVNHNLGVVPELIISKWRSGTQEFRVFYGENSTGSSMGRLNSDAATAFWNYGANWGGQSTTTTITPLGATAGRTYVAYLFASCPGVSKVGSYTGNGSSQTINCGFTGGARFVMIKRTDSTGDWYVWDTARGIVSGNDPHLSLNTTASEVTTDDTIDTDSTGFVVNQVSATNVNVSSATYIYLAIA